MLGGYDMTKKI